MTSRERAELELSACLKRAATYDKDAEKKFRAVQRIVNVIVQEAQRIPPRLRWGSCYKARAVYHRKRAAIIAEQLERYIYSDDPDAPERLRWRIAGLEATRRTEFHRVGAIIRRLRSRLAKLEASRKPARQDNKGEMT